MKISYRLPRPTDRVLLPGWTCETPWGHAYMRDLIRHHIRDYWDDHGANHPWLVRGAVLLGVAF